MRAAAAAAVWEGFAHVCHDCLISLLVTLLSLTTDVTKHVHVVDLKDEQNQFNLRSLNQRAYARRENFELAVL